MIYKYAKYTRIYILKILCLVFYCKRCELIVYKHTIKWTEINFVLECVDLECTKNNVPYIEFRALTMRYMYISLLFY